MEHRLITGGHEYLPFARSAITKLKKLGLPYASQSFEIGGASIKVRIEPGHEYIRIEGGGNRGFIENMFLVGPNNPATESEVNVYLAAKDEAAKTPEAPKLLKYTGKENKWAVRQKTKAGVATGYSIVSTPESIPENPKGDKDYFDVVYKKESKLKLSKTNGVGNVIPELPDTHPFPALIPPDKNAPDDDLNAKDSHAFFMSSAGVQHISARIRSIDAEHVTEDAITTISSTEQNMAITATQLGSPSFGVVAGVVADSLAHNAFGTRITYGMDGLYLNVYYWCITCNLTRTPPYVKMNKRSIVLRNYKHWIDVTTGADAPSVSYNYPLEYDLSGSAGTVADIMQTNYELTRSEPDLGRNWWIAVSHSPAGTISGGSDSVSGTSQVAIFKNTVNPYSDTYLVGAQDGKVTVTHAAEVRIDFKYQYSNAAMYTTGYAPPESWNSWAGLIYPNGITETPPVYVGSSIITSTTNTSTTSVSYKLSTGDLLFSQESTIAYNARDSLAVTSSYTQTERSTSVGDVTEFTMPLGEVPEKLIYYTWATNTYATSTSVETVTPEWDQTSSATLTIRDYIFHDVANDVAVYIESVGTGTKNSAQRTIYTGESNWVVSAVVIARGVKSVIELSRTMSSGHNLWFEEHDFLINKADQPTYFDPIPNIALYSPVCEQGDFPYIAYTTKAEEALGVPRRFILALPLGLQRADDIYGTDPQPPTGSYRFTMLNLTDAYAYMKGNPFSGLKGKCFQISVSHDGKRDWLNDVSGSSPAECYRV